MAVVAWVSIKSNGDGHGEKIHRLTEMTDCLFALLLMFCSVILEISVCFSFWRCSFAEVSSNNKGASSFH